MRTGKLVFLIVSVVAVIIILLISNNLVKELARQERERMNIWAQATERLAQAQENADYEFLLSIIQQNNSIPVLVADSDFNIIEYRNFRLPEKIEQTEGGFVELSEKNRAYLIKRLKAPGGDTPLEEMARKNDHFIRVEIYTNTYQYIYYEDSILLKRLSLYPYVQLAVMFVMVLIIYFAVVYSKRAEQNRVWAGLSKETAHQLGTPISSLMAWVELMRDSGIAPEITDEMDKDVRRLETIASRFSKIGSPPAMERTDLRRTIGEAVDYMKSRISPNITLTIHRPDTPLEAEVSPPLLQWVMENLIKNAVDAMINGRGAITVDMKRRKDTAIITVTDTGRGISRKNFKRVFEPGHTTKKRGWGLGLTLARRIIEQYHGGRIFVSHSDPGTATTFEIQIPLL